MVAGSLAALVTLGGTADSQARLGAVSGRATSAASERGIRGAVVEIVGHGIRVTTDTTGTYRMSGVIPGEVRVTLRALGFQPMEAVVMVSSDSLSLANFRLEPVSELPAVQVEEAGLRRGDERMRGFYSRKATGFGKFVTRADIERRNVSDVKELLRGMPGVRLVGNRIQMASAQSSPRCAVQFFVDAIHIGMTSADFLSTFRPGDIEGIEVYRGPAETPPDFSRGGAGCGVVVIWTRTPGGRR